MNLSDSKYYNSLPPYVQEGIRNSRMAFESDEEVSMYIERSGGLAANSFFMGYPYTPGFGPGWPFGLF